jgi:hypothetical protein
MNHSVALPYRGTFGDPRPPELASLPLPPDPMPSHLGGRALKAWRYVGVYGPELMVCAASLRVGRVRRAFWAVWDRAAGHLHEGTSGVSLGYGRVLVADGAVGLALAVAEEAGVETVCPSGDGYAWTRKQGGVTAGGTLTLPGEPPRSLAGSAVIDDTAAYYQRHTAWRWSAGVGRADDGRPIAWNLVAGVNDPLVDSERTVWVDGVPSEAPPVTFAEDLSAVGELRFASEAVRESHENLLVARSRYRQPFGTFSGTLPGGAELAEGWGVMEDHDVHW